MVERKEYLDQLWAWKDERQIKVVTGIRRCGKSVLLEQYQQRLLANGVAPEQIISINFENLDYEPLKDYMRLYNYLKERLCVDKMTYIFLDEVQEVPSFEKVVDSLYIRDHVDVYITGSNAYMLSSELATLLSGRYTEIKMLPLSFREYMAVTGMAKEEAFAEFMKTGGIPYVAVMNRTDEKIDQYLEGIYNTVIVKDIEQRQTRREKESGKRKITDIALLKTIARYLASVIGSPVSMKSITDYLISAGRRETHFIPNGVNRPEVREAKLIRDNFGLEKDSYILFLGRLVPEKGIRYLVEAFKNVKTDKKLVIAGGSSDTDTPLQAV